jgi:cysteine desulfurase/selenocysteine lyase
LRKSVYLDNAATSYPKPEEVYLAMDRFAREVGGNPGRSGHRRSLEAGRELLRCRESLARLLGVGDSSRIILTRNATEALNLAILSLIKPGGHVLLSSLEHNSIWRPVHHACETTGAAYDIVPCAPDGQLDPESIKRALKPNTSLLVFTHASNVLGTLLPVRDISRIARSHGAMLLLDAAQTAGRYPLDVEAYGLDLVAFSGHKELFGPPGTGGLYIAPGLDLEPILRGGTGSDSTSPEQPSFLPDRFESGTANPWGAAGLRAGVEYVMAKGVETIRHLEEELTSRLLEGLREIPGTTIYGPMEWEKRIGVVSFNLRGLASTDAAACLNEVYDIAVRAGLHCSPLAHRVLGTLEAGTIRVGFSCLNVAEDVELLLAALRSVVKSQAL